MWNDVWSSLITACTNSLNVLECPPSLWWRLESGGSVASFEETKIRKNMINIYHRISAPLFFCSLEFCVLRYLRNPTYMPHASFYSCCGHLFLETDRRWRTRFLVYNISIQFSCFAFSTLKRALYRYNSELRIPSAPVRSDFGIKWRQYIKNCPKCSHSSFLEKGCFLKLPPKSPNIWGTLVRKFVTKTFQK